MNALVTDTHDRAALAGLRGLGRAGVRAIALSPEHNGPGIWSRYAAGREIGPDPTRDPRGFALKVGQILDQHGERLVYPGREEAIDALLDMSSPPALRKALPYHSLEGLAAVRDKRRLPELAETGGLSTPRTVFEGPLDDLDSTHLEFPVVIKSALAAGGLPRPWTVRTADELTRLKASGTPGETIIAQELREGPLAAISLVLGPEGAIVARFQQRTTVTWPPEMGVSAVARSVEPDADLIERVARMLRAARFDGLAQVQILECPGQPAVIDINPRFYGSLPLAMAAGVNLPALWHASASGQPVPEPSDYRVGVVFRWFEARLFALARGTAQPRYGKRGEVRSGAVWARDDPLASAAAVATTLRGAVRKRMRSARSS